MMMVYFLSQLQRLMGMIRSARECHKSCNTFAGPLARDAKMQQFTFNCLPNDKILDWSKLKAFEGKKINVAQKMNSIFFKMDNIQGKEENVGYQHFLLFPLCFQKPSVQVWDSVVKG